MEITFFGVVKILSEINCAALFIFTLTSFFGRYPYLELLTHFRLQYVWLSIICLILLILLNSWLFSALAFLTILINLSYLFPYYFPVKRVKNLTAKPLKIMTANVEYRNKNYDKLLKAVASADPDILILQELNAEWWKNVEKLKDVYQFYKSNPQERGSGLAIFSRYPLENAQFINLDRSERQSFVCSVNLGETVLSLLTIHPFTPMNIDKFRSRNLQFIEAAKLINTLPEPKILMGDFNITMWSPYFSDLVKNSGLRDARIGRGLLTTWISFFPSLFRIPIDHCLISENIEIEKVELGNSTGSDHLPLLVNFTL